MSKAVLITLIFRVPLIKFFTVLSLPFPLLQKQHTSGARLYVPFQFISLWKYAKYDLYKVCSVSPLAFRTLWFKVDIGIDVLTVLGNR